MVIFKRKMIEKESNQKIILSEAFLSFSGMSLGSVFRYMFSIIMARFLGAQMLGLYSLGNAITRIAEILALLGLDNGVLRFVSRDTEDKVNVDRSIYTSLKIGLISSILIAVLLFLSAEKIVNEILNEDSFLITVIKVFAISLPFTVLTLISSFATQAFKILKYKIFVNQIVNPLTLLIAFVTSYFLLGIELSILLPTVVSSIIGLIFILKFLTNFSSISLSKIIGTTVDKDILKFSVPLMFVSAIGIIMHWIDIIMLGILSNATEVGMYHPIERTAGLVRMILFAFAGIFAPIFSEHYFKKNKNGMKDSYQSSSKYILAFSLPIFIFLFIFSEPMLLVFGTEFQNYFALKVLLLGIFIQTIFGLGSSTLTMSGYTKFNLLNVSIALVLNIISNSILIPLYGLTGAALATSFALIVLSTLRYFENLILMNLNLFSFKLIKPIISGAITFVVIQYLSLIFSNYFELSNVFNLLIYLLINLLLVISSYFTIYFLLGFDKEDIIFINSLKSKMM
jgi:O-antigen/teichoic acid export membrane protein